MKQLPRTPRAVLLDALGTLLELEPPTPLLRAELARRFGLEVTEGDARRAIAAEIAYYRAHHDEGADRAGLADLRRRCAAVVRDALAPAADRIEPAQLTPALLAALRFRPFPEVPAALAALRAAGLRLVVVSNWDVSLHEVLERTGLARHLDGAVASAELGASKPAPAIFARALALAGVAAGDALHVGDTLEADVAGARAAGIEPVLVVRHAGDPRPAGVRTIRSLDELVALAS